MNGETSRESVLKYAAEQYGTEPEYLWMSDPEYAVLRHPCGKWYGVIMNVPNFRLGLMGEGETDILAFKCERELIPLLLTQEGYLPAYHLNKEHWAAARLDGSLPMEQVKQLLDMSFEMVTPKRKRRAKTEDNAEI